MELRTQENAGSSAAGIVVVAVQVYLKEYEAKEYVILADSFVAASINAGGVGGCVPAAAASLLHL
jgi:hypothetical protein